MLMITVQNAPFLEIRAYVVFYCKQTERAINSFNDVTNRFNKHLELEPTITAVSHLTPQQMLIFDHFPISGSEIRPEGNR